MSEQDIPAVTVQAGLASGAADSGPETEEE
jgi:hypothetical protein